MAIRSLTDEERGSGSIRLTCINCGIIFTSYRNLMNKHFLANDGSSGPICYQKVLQVIEDKSTAGLDPTNKIRLEILRDTIEQDLRRMPLPPKLIKTSSVHHD